MNLYRLAGLAFFVAAVVFFVSDNAGTGAAFVALGVVFTVMDSRGNAHSKD